MYREMNQNFISYKSIGDGENGSELNDGTKCLLGAVGSTIQTRSPVLRSMFDDLHHFER